MKICLCKYKSHSSDSINDVVENSLIDLGHTLVSHCESDVIIVIRDLSHIKEQYPDKKYILFQIEQYAGKSKQIDEFYDSGVDEIWGFDIENKNEIYMPLGYHPCLEFESQLSSEDIDVGFLGWQRGRRDKLLSKAKNKWKSLNTFNNKIRGENIFRTKVNLNIHFHENSTFTEWGRIAYFLANEQFFISEHFYCPIHIPQFRTISQYDLLVDYYLKNTKERKDIALEISQIYKCDFDMRDILRKRL